MVEPIPIGESKEIFGFDPSVVSIGNSKPPYGNSTSEKLNLKQSLQSNFKSSRCF